jgi:3-oxoacyl-[acyl-carrier protein] reductase
MDKQVVSKLINKVALVTGGSRGIGAAIAKRLAGDGASVAITYAKDASAASAVVKAIELNGGKAIAIRADAADVEAVKGAVEKTVSTFGQLDVLVNNAGTAIPKPFEEATLEEMNRVSINVRGVCSYAGAEAHEVADASSRPGGGVSRRLDLCPTLAPRVP